MLWLLLCQQPIDSLLPALRRDTAVGLTELLPLCRIYTCKFGNWQILQEWNILISMQICYVSLRDFNSASSLLVSILN